MAQNIVIFHNDLTDSDNWTAARILFHAVSNSLSTRVIWIIEPRKASLGHGISQEERAECLELLKQHFSAQESPIRILLRGTLQPSDIDSIEDLSDHQRKLLNYAVRPEDGSREDAELHGRLTSLDFLACLAGWSKDPVQVHLDVDALDNLQNPVNLKVHYHEELISRTKEELESYNVIMSKRGHKRRVQELEAWYRQCIADCEQACRINENILCDLNMDALCETIKSAEKVIFFGGASLGLLQRLLRRHDNVASKIHCYVQAGTFDHSKLIFGNQFNVALDPPAASFVFSQYRKFASFNIIPSSSASLVKYSLRALSDGGDTRLQKVCLGYNVRVDPLKLATDFTSFEHYLDRQYTMPDLTALLCALPAGLNTFSIYAAVEKRENDTLVLVETSDPTGIPARGLCDVDSELFLSDSTVNGILSTLTVDWRTGVGSNSVAHNWFEWLISILRTLSG